MPEISQMTAGRYLKQADVGKGMLLTIESCVRENVAKREEAEELKWVLYFAETDLGMVLNTVNTQLAAKAVGLTNSDHWAGHKIVAYTDPTISMGGKITGGIRIRAPKGQTAPLPAPPPGPSFVPRETPDSDPGDAPDDDGLPFKAEAIDPR